MVRVVRQGPCTVLLETEERPRPLPGHVERSVTAVWDGARAKNPSLFNGVLMSAVELRGDALVVRPAEYRHFVAQRVRPELREHLPVTPVAVSGLIVTADGQWLLGYRSDAVTQYPGHLEAVPSGSLDARALGGRPVSSGLLLDPLACLMAELSEEAAILPESVSDVRPLGLFLDVDEHTYDLGYLIRLRVTALDVQQRFAGAASAPEYGRLMTFPHEHMGAQMAQSRVVPTTVQLWQAAERLSTGGEA